MGLCEIEEIRALLGRHGFRCSKSLGQNFLIDAAIPAAIAAASGAREAAYALEIGPGIGCLTEQLAGCAKQVAAVELDRALLPILQETLCAYQNIEIIQGDVLTMDLKRLCIQHFGAQARVVACANLPYYITTPAITALLESQAFEQITVMVQKEVAQRICATAGSKQYSAFSIYVQYHAQADMLFDVPSSSFLPQPKVDSTVLRLRPLPAPAVQVGNESLFFQLVHAAFQMRRKTLVNALLPVLGERLGKEGIITLLQDMGLDTQIRGERLTLEDFAQLADAVDAGVPKQTGA